MSITGDVGRLFAAWNSINSMRKGDHVAFACRRSYSSVSQVKEEKEMGKTSIVAIPCRIRLCFLVKRCSETSLTRIRLKTMRTMDEM